MQLTEQQYQFAEHYLHNGADAVKAALDAGYTQQYANTQSYLLPQHPGIKQRIQDAMEHARADTESMRSMVMSVQERSRILETIIYDIVPRDGSPPKRELYKDALRAIAELNKMSGDYAPERKLSLTADLTANKIKDIQKVYNEF